MTKQCRICAFPHFTYPIVWPQQTSDAKLYNSVYLSNNARSLSHSFFNIVLFFLYVCLIIDYIFTSICVHPFFTILIITYFNISIQFSSFKSYQFICVKKFRNVCSRNKHTYFSRCLHIYSKYQQYRTLLQIIPQNYSITLSQSKVWIKKNLHVIFCIIFVICRIVFYFWDFKLVNNLYHAKSCITRNVYPQRFFLIVLPMHWNFETPYIWLFMLKLLYIRNKITKII